VAVGAAAGGPLGELGEQINRLLETSSAGLNECTARLHGLVADTRAAAEKVADGCEAESDAAADMAAALAETERAIRRIGSSLASARQTAGSLADLGEQSLVAVDRLAAVVDAIGRTSTGINEISREIATIASRTQFLCLNASIEASRSGDQGKGFGVVAQEVGKLAERAHQHSRQLATLVEQGNAALADGKSTAVTVSGMIQNLVGVSRQTVQLIDSSAVAVEAPQASLGRIGNVQADWLANAARRTAATREMTALLDRTEPAAEPA
jgi:methyl-accepting chemotaxis protein